jgi:hypothetical protein
MAFAQMSAKDKDPVVAVFQPLEDIEWINAARTHGADNPDGGRVLKT